MLPEPPKAKQPTFKPLHEMTFKEFARAAERKPFDDYEGDAWHAEQDWRHSAADCRTSTAT
jgi:hypothetical protein